MSRLADRLTLPLNPAHDVTQDPTIQPELANPVTLNNYELIYGNAMIEVTQLSINVNNKIEASRKAQREATRALEDIDEAVLVAHPAPTACKTVKQQQAWIAARAVEMNLTDSRQALVTSTRAIEDQLAKLKADAWHCSLWVDAIKLASDNMKTHLSYVKDERRRG